MDRFCIITNRDKDESMAVTKRICGLLRAEGKQFCLADINCRPDGSCYTRTEDVPEGTECVIVLGGDGTLLQLRHHGGKLQNPILPLSHGSHHPGQ